MFLIDGPYSSDFLKQTILKFDIPIIETPAARQQLAGLKLNFIDERSARERLNKQPDTLVYTNSENALGWLYDNLPESDLVHTILSVKHKVKFRQILSEQDPQFYFKAYDPLRLKEINPEQIPFPVILKPAVGFFSLGVQQIDSARNWVKALAEIDQTISASQGLYPPGVLDNSSFIIEEVIPGDEFAIDCYFDAAGKVVILNLMQHLFASSAAVNDRVYITSGRLVEQNLPRIQNYLNSLGGLFKLSNFPAHIEIRINNNQLNVIEINPLRFGGWCSTPDIAQYVWDMNIYEVLINKHEPDWQTLVRSNPDKTYALVVLDNSTGHSGREIKSFNYKALLKQVSTPLELRKTNYQKFPVFGFLMCSVPADDPSELYALLHSDLMEYITT